MKMSKYLKDADGSWSWKRITGLLMVPVTMFVLSKGYDRYAWLRDQAYKVDKQEISITKLEDQAAVLQRRISEEADKREDKDEKLMGLIIDILKGQQQQMNLQQERLNKSK